MSMVSMTYQYKCSICDRTHTEYSGVPIGGKPQYPCLPVGWLEMNGRTICNAHKVELVIDYERFVLANPALPADDFRLFKEAADEYYRASVFPAKQP